MTRQQFVDTVGFWNITARQGQGSSCGAPNTAVAVYVKSLSIDINKFNAYCAAKKKEYLAQYPASTYRDVYAQQICDWCSWASNENVVKKPEWA